MDSLTYVFLAFIIINLAFSGLIVGISKTTSPKAVILAVGITEIFVGISYLDFLAYEILLTGALFAMILGVVGAVEVLQEL